MTATARRSVRCAIYTRVSTDSGLDQDFNSLDAQYDAAQAYIRSQAHAGWTLVQTKLDQQRTNHAKTRQQSQSLLMGRIFDERGNRMTPSYAVKNAVRYRYYISSVLIQGQPDKAAKLNRVPATEIEKLILSAVRKHLVGNPHNI